MAEVLQKILTVTLVIFMVGNLLELGLKLQIREAWLAIRDVRFLVLSIVWCFVLSPAFAVLLTKVVPLAEPYALGLLFLGMAPCAPFVPLLAEKAGGALGSTAAFMLLAAVGTVIFMPFAVPLLARNFSADPWTIAKPLVFFVVTPLVAGVAIRQSALAFAEKFHPVVKRVTGVDTVIMLVIMVWLYWRDYLSAAGSYAIGTQILYLSVLAAAPYAFGFGLPHSQKSVLAVGLCTRNIGAAFAPLFAAPGTDKRALVMCAMTPPIMVIAGVVAAKLLARRAPIPDRASAAA